MVLRGIALHRIAFDYLLRYCMVFYCLVLHRLHGVVQLIWLAGELPRSASSHFVAIAYTELCDLVSSSSVLLYLCMKLLCQKI